MTGCTANGILPGPLPPIAWKDGSNASIPESAWRELTTATGRPAACRVAASGTSRPPVPSTTMRSGARASRRAQCLDPGLVVGHALPGLGLPDCCRSASKILEGGPLDVGDRLAVSWLGAPGRSDNPHGIGSGFLAHGATMKPD